MQVLDLIPTPILAFRKQGHRIVYANQASIDAFGPTICGAELSDAIGLSLVNSEFTFKQSMKQLRTGRDILDVAVEVQCADGRTQLARASFLAHPSRSPVIAIIDISAMDLPVALRRVARSLLTPTDSGSDLLQLTSSARAICRADRAYLKLYDPLREVFRYTALSSHIADEIFPEATSPRDRGMTGSVFARKTCKYIPDMRTAPAGSFVQGFTDTVAKIAVPLLDDSIAEGCMGVLVVDGTRPNQFSSYHVAILQLFADFATVTIQQVELVAKARASAAGLLARQSRLYSLPEVSEIVHGTKNMVVSLVEHIRRLSEIAASLPRTKALVEELGHQERAATSTQAMLSALLKALPGARRLLKDDDDLTESPRPVDVGLIVREVGWVLPQIADRGRVELNLDGVETGHTVTGTPEELTLLFYSLLSNAFNAMRRTEASGVVRVCVSSSRGQPGMVRVVVEDDGPGISRAELESIRQGKPFSRTKGGTGLGLLGVRATIDALRGTITIDSQFGHGARFTIELPRG